MTMDRARAALEAIGQLPDGEIAIADAALQLASIDQPDGDMNSARDHLSVLARDAVALAGTVAEDDLVGQAVGLARLMGEVHRYAGDTRQYDDPANANLLRVIERRRGLPVALGVLWLHAARAAGWGCHGVDFPGHFVLALAHKGTQLVVDVFNGGAPMDAPALRALVKSVEGPAAELRPGLLRPMSTRAVLLRLQNNIKLRRLQAGDMPGALACTEDMLRIAPDEAGQWRDAAVMHQRLDQLGDALRCGAAFLRLVPEGTAAERMRAAMAELRARLN
ncbi:MAG: transglutaminase family protein [Acetobacteraceae bacterium]|nr:transglutaminase family protein [Acetobacteraceae bacterium]